MKKNLNTSAHSLLVLACIFCLNSIISLQPGLAQEADSQLLDNEARAEFAELAQYEAAVSAALQAKPPLLNLLPLAGEQQAALQIATEQPSFLEKLFDPISKKPFRNELFSVRPSLTGDSIDSESLCANKKCWTIEVFNFTRNSSLRVLIDLQAKKLLLLREIKGFIPEIPAHFIS